jgi:hypothetical protein
MEEKAIPSPQRFTIKQPKGELSLQQRMEVLKEELKEMQPLFSRTAYLDQAFLQNLGEKFHGVNFPAVHATVLKTNMPLAMKMHTKILQRAIKRVDENLQKEAEIAINSKEPSIPTDNLKQTSYDSNTTFGQLVHFCGLIDAEDIQRWENSGTNPVRLV